jgi:transposase-like protein
MVEVDEMYIGGKEYNKHQSKKHRAGTGYVGKKAVVAIREKGGKTRAMPVEKVDTETLTGTVVENVEAGSTVHTDEHAGYRRLSAHSYTHETVAHTRNEYVRGNVTTNGVESVFAVLKRGLHGVYHHASEKHLGRYVDEFAFRLNEGNCKRRTMDRIDSLVDFTVGRRITYKELIK